MILTAWLVLILALLIIFSWVAYLTGGLLEGLAVVLTTILLIGSAVAIAWSLTILL